MVAGGAKLTVRAIWWAINLGPRRGRGGRAARAREVPRQGRRPPRYPDRRQLTDVQAGIHDTNKRWHTVSRIGALPGGDELVGADHGGVA